MNAIICQKKKFRGFNSETKVVVFNNDKHFRTCVSSFISPLYRYFIHSCFFLQNYCHYMTMEIFTKKEEINSQELGFKFSYFFSAESNFPHSVRLSNRVGWTRL